MSRRYDTKDYVGSRSQRNRGLIVRSIGGDQYIGVSYASFGMPELDEMAHVLVPKAITATAELIRYFYGVVDQQGPRVELVGLGSQDPDAPQAVSGSFVKLTAAASDQSSGDSGVGKDKFVFEVRSKSPHGGWSD